MYVYIYSVCVCFNTICSRRCIPVYMLNKQTIPGAPGKAFSRKSETFSLEPICRSLGDPTMAMKVEVLATDFGWLRWFS